MNRRQSTGPYKSNLTLPGSGGGGGGDLRLKVAGRSKGTSRFRDVFFFKKILASIFILPGIVFGIKKNGEIAIRNLLW